MQAEGDEDRAADWRARWLESAADELTAPGSTANSAGYGRTPTADDETPFLRRPVLRPAPPTVSTAGRHHGVDGAAADGAASGRAGRHCAPDDDSGDCANLVRFLPGDGTELWLDVSYVAVFPRASNGSCAFCLGDPAAALSGPDTPIGAYFAGNSDAFTCPVCEGRPA